MSIPALWASICSSRWSGVRQRQSDDLKGNREGFPFYPAAPADRSRSEGRKWQRRGMVHRNDGAESPCPIWLEPQETQRGGRDSGEPEPRQARLESAESPQNFLYELRNDSSRPPSGARPVVPGSVQAELVERGTSHLSGSSRLRVPRHPDSTRIN